jgi:5-methyltetrahydropteroyltriglutamate--homocysteine methyltransferase
MSNSPLFPTTVVGSMPRPRMVQELLDPETGARLGPDVLRSRMDSAVRFMIVMMESAGIDIISDGEWRRRSYTDVVAQMVDGFAPGDQHPTRTGAHFFTVEEPLHNHRHLIAEEARFLKANTDRKVKVCLPSPFILGQRMWHPEVSKAAYPTRRDFVRATVPILRAELEAVRDAGIDVVQIDEPHLSGFCDPVGRREFDDPDSDLDFLVGCLNDVVSGVTGITIALHICHFNTGRRGTGWVNEGGYAPIIPALKSLDVQQYTLEFSIPVAGDIEVLTEIPDDRDVAVGCVDCRSANVDTPEEIAARIETAMRYHPKERILLAPDCGFAPHLQSAIPLDEAYTKLQNEVQAAQILRERHG